MFEYTNCLFVSSLYLTYAKHHEGIDILKNNLDKINWWCLSRNPNAIDIIKNNLDKIDNWSELSQNKSIFELNTQDIYNNLS